MSHAQTIQHHTTGNLIRTLRVEVVAGTNKGLITTGRTDRVTIGSAPGNDLVLSDDTVSRYHLELRAEADRIVVEDHGSTNGTAIGPVQISRATIAPGTELKLGRSSIRADDGVSVSVPLHDADELSGVRGKTQVMRRLM